MKFIVLVCMIIVASFPLLAEERPLFPGPSFLAGKVPVSIVTSDFNGDGYIDAAVVNKDSNDISVLLNNGKGGFLHKVQYPVSEEPQSIYCADFNNDNYADLAISYDGVGIDILFGNSSGDFQDATNHIPSQSPIFLFQSAYIGSVNLCNETGGFTVGELLIAPGLTADFNGDGYIDRLIRNGGVFLGDGTGTFSKTINSLTGVFDSYVSADFNEDGYDDIAIADVQSGQIVIFTSNGVGGFLATKNISLENDISILGMFLRDIIAVDFDEDGNMDIVAGLPLVGDFIVLLGDGGGGFSEPITYNIKVDSRIKKIIDFDNDGFLDIISIGATGITIQFGDEGGGFVSPRYYTTESVSSRSVTSGDFNGDGDSDIAVIVNSNYAGKSISVLLGDGLGGLSSPVHYYYDEEFTITRIDTSEDFNGDGKDDLIVTGTVTVGFFNYATISVLLSSDSGGFTSREYLRNPFPTSPIINDYNGDGFVDIAVFDQESNFKGSLNILLNDGFGGFSLVENIFDGSLLSVSGITSADFNDDGYVDIAATGSFGTNIFLGDGAGSFVRGNTYASALGVQITHEDFNRDGNVDLAIIGSVMEDSEGNSGSTVKILLGDGVGNYTTISENIINGMLPFAKISSADINGDSYPDIVLSYSGVVVLLFNDGSGGFYDNGRRYSAGIISSIAISDFDGNGRLDIATNQMFITNEEAVEYRISVLLNQSNSSLPSGTISIEGGKFATNDREVVLSLSCGDNVECTQMQFSNDNATWSLPVGNASSVSWMLAEGDDGLRTIYARFIDGDNNISLVVSDEIWLDTISPSAPVILEPIDDKAADVLSQPIISGTAENGTTVVIRDGESILGEVSVVNNVWSLPESGSLLTEGVHRFVATAIDKAGNISPASRTVVYTVNSTNIPEQDNTIGGGGGGGGGGIDYLIILMLITIFGSKYSCRLRPLKRLELQYHQCNRSNHDVLSRLSFPP